MTKNNGLDNDSSLVARLNYKIMSHLGNLFVLIAN